MKKRLITLLLIVLFPVISTGQTFLFDINGVATGTVKDDYVDGEFISNVIWGEFEKTNLSMVIDLDDYIIKINNELKTTLYLDKGSVKTQYVLDGDGDKTTIMVFNAIDEENIKCKVKLRSWEDYNIFQLYIIYNNIRVCFDGEFKSDVNQTRL